MLCINAKIFGINAELPFLKLALMLKYKLHLCRIPVSILG